MDNFLFVDLAMLEEAKAFDGVAAGEFTDMWGRDFEIKAEELSVFVSNTMRNIEATRTEGGELVGLPIDVDHDKGDSAGWIVAVDMAMDGRNVIRITPKWTEIGKSLISSGQFRFFSPTLDMKQKVILGGGLTNWPATREENGKILLRPIELSQEIQTIGKPSLFELVSDAIKQGFENVLHGLKPKDIEPEHQPDENHPTEDDMPIELSQLKAEDLAALKAQVREEMTSGDTPAELAQMIEDKAKERLAQMVKAEQRKMHVAEFAARVVGGTEDKPSGLPVQQDDLEGFLLSLSAEQQEQAEAILNGIVEKGLIEFSEAGHNRRVSGQAELPEFIAKKLDSGDMKLADLSNPMLGLGDLSDYNLAKWQEE